MKTVSKDARNAIGNGILASAGAPHEIDSGDESMAQTTHAVADQKMMEGEAVRTQPFQEEESGSLERTRQRKSKERVNDNSSKGSKGH